MKLCASLRAVLYENNYDFLKWVVSYTSEEHASLSALILPPLHLSRLQSYKIYIVEELKFTLL